MARISIIEDDQLIAQMYRMKLEEEGYDVDVAENGMNGIKMVAQTMPDLIILCLMLMVRRFYVRFGVMARPLKRR